MRRTVCFAARVAIAMAALTSSLVAHEGATGVVKERMDGMESLGKSMKSIGQRIKANRDLGAIKQHAQVIRSLAPKMVAWFPPDSNQHPSEAKAAIWQHWSDFQSKADMLEVEAGKLATVDTSNLKALTAQVRAVSQVCGGCHELYRRRKN